LFPYPYLRCQYQEHRPVNSEEKTGRTGHAFDDGYGKIKGKTFRIAHMGDMSVADLEELFSIAGKILATL